MIKNMYLEYNNNYNTNIIRYCRSITITFNIVNIVISPQVNFRSHNKQFKNLRCYQDKNKI